LRLKFNWGWCDLFLAFRKARKLGTKQFLIDMQYYQLHIKLTTLKNNWWLADSQELVCKKIYVELDTPRINFIFYITGPEEEVCQPLPRTPRMTVSKVNVYYM
jgi:hypothetical protein